MRYTFLLVLLLLSSCAGLGYSTLESRVSSIAQPLVSKDKGYLTASGNSLSATELRKHWGEPDSIELSDGQEKWTYNFSAADKGFFALLVIIPLPFIFSDGYQNIVFTIQNDLILQADARYQYETSRGCVITVLVHAFADAFCFEDRKFLKGNIPLVFYRE